MRATNLLDGGGKRQNKGLQRLARSNPVIERAALPSKKKGKDLVLRLRVAHAQATGKDVVFQHL